MIPTAISPGSIELVRSRFLPSVPVRRGAIKRIYSMAGIPAAGKSSFVARMIKGGTFPRNAFVLSPDSIMEFLPEYIVDMERLGPESAFARWEEPSVNLAYDLLRIATDQGSDIIIDMGLARPESLDMLRRFKVEAGYRIFIYWLETPIDVALERIKHRVRHTPMEMVRTRALTLSVLRPKYQALADEFHVIPYDPRSDERA